MALHRATVELDSRDELLLRCSCGWTQDLGQETDLLTPTIEMSRHAVDVIGPQCDPGSTLTYAFQDDD